MTVTLRETVAPTEEPVTRDEVKIHSRISHTVEDDWLDKRIIAARRHVEAYTRRQLVTATWQMFMDGFPSSSTTSIMIPLPPLQSVDSVVYNDADGNQQSWLVVTHWQSDIRSMPGRLMPIEGGTYPTTQASTFNTVTVQFTAGYGAASAVPDDIKTAMFMLIDHWYEHRSAVDMKVSNEVAMGVQRLLLPYRIWYEPWPLP